MQRQGDTDTGGGGVKKQKKENSHTHWNDRRNAKNKIKIKSGIFVFQSSCDRTPASFHSPKTSMRDKLETLNSLFVVCVCLFVFLCCPADELVNSHPAIAPTGAGIGSSRTPATHSVGGSRHRRWMDGWIKTKDNTYEEKQLEYQTVNNSPRRGGQKESETCGNRRKQTRKSRSEANMNVPLRPQMGQEG